MPGLNNQPTGDTTETIGNSNDTGDGNTTPNEGQPVVKLTKMQRTAVDAVKDILKIDQERSKLATKDAELKSERGDLITFVRGIEKLLKEKFLPEGFAPTATAGRARRANSLGSVILSCLAEGEANSKKMVDYAQANGYVFGGTTKHSSRIASELQRLKKDGKVESTGERGFYRLIAQPEPTPPTEPTPPAETEETAVTGEIAGAVATETVKQPEAANS